MNNSLFYTVCTIQNLAEALLLSDTLKSQSADYQLVIGLLDDKKRISNSLKITCLLIEISEIHLPNFGAMCEKYSNEELLTDTKPFFAEHIFKKFQEVETLIYLDCASLVFNKFDLVFEKLSSANILIVPQIIQANVHPDEKQILNTGIFHAGFFGLKRSEETFKFLIWWQKRLSTKGYIQLCKGMNADQLWLEHVPIFFENVVIEKHEGLNVGTWNASERTLRFADNHWFCNHSDLVHQNFSHAIYPKSYQALLATYHWKTLRKIQPIFGLKIQPKKPSRISKYLRNFSQTIDYFMDKLS